MRKSPFPRNTVRKIVKRHAPDHRLQKGVDILVRLRSLFPTFFLISLSLLSHSLARSPAHTQTHTLTHSLSVTLTHTQIYMNFLMFMKDLAAETEHVASKNNARVLKKVHVDQALEVGTYASRHISSSLPLSAEPPPPPFFVCCCWQLPWSPSPLVPLHLADVPETVPRVIRRQSRRRWEAV